MTLLERKGGGEDLKRAAEARRNDLLVYLGLANPRKLGINDQVGFGPTKSEFEALLVRHGLNENLNTRRGSSARGTVPTAR